MRIKRWFTLWYLRRGYAFYYKEDGSVLWSNWLCPRWVRPLLFLFDPELYLQAVAWLVEHAEVVGPDD